MHLFVAERCERVRNENTDCVNAGSFNSASVDFSTLQMNSDKLYQIIVLKQSHEYLFVSHFGMYLQWHSFSSPFYIANIADVFSL